MEVRVLSWAPLTSPQPSAQIDSVVVERDAWRCLLAGSPAINSGSNPDALDTDARGVGFLRSVAGPDIGAYERQLNDDELFYDGFD